MTKPLSRRAVGGGGNPTVCAGIVSAACILVADVVGSAAPDDHFSASPHCRVIGAVIRRASGAGCGPIINAAARWIFKR